MKTSQSFPFYPTDFLIGTMFMTPAQVGGYIRALCYQWESGGFPTLPEDQKRVTGCGDEDLKIILGKFIEKRGVLVNKRMEEVRRARAQYAKTQRDNGKKGGRPKQNPSVSIGLSQTKPKKSLPSPLPFPSPSPNIPPNPQGGDEVDFRCREITERIKSEYRATTGNEMAINEGKDVPALAAFLEGWMGTPDQFLKIAKAAWRRSKEPYASATKQAHSLAGLCRNFGAIVAESEAAPAPTKPASGRPSSSSGLRPLPTP